MVGNVLAVHGDTQQALPRPRVAAGCQLDDEAAEALLGILLRQQDHLFMRGGCLLAK